MEVSSGSEFRKFPKEGVADGSRVSCRYLVGTEHGEGRECMMRNEVEENRDHRPAGDGEMIGPQTQLH